MSRGARLAVGLTAAGLLLLVSLVSVVVGAVAASGDEGFSEGMFAEEYVDFSTYTERVDGEVLDVDQEYGWTWVDVRFDTGDEVVVTGFDWTGGRAPQVGDTVEVAYDPVDPEYLVASADDAGAAVAGDELGADAGSGAPVVDDGPMPRAAVVAFWVAGSSGALALLIVLATVVAAVRAPVPARRAYGDPLPGAARADGVSPAAYVPPAAYAPPVAVGPPGMPPASPPPGAAPAASTGWGSPSA